MAKTRKAKSSKAKMSKGKVLKVDSANKIAAMEKLLGKGSITFVLIYADWCGACTRFKKNIWNPMCEKSAAHSRIAVRDDMIGKTSLSSANFDYLPSLVVVDENGKMQSFKTPEGKDTHAMPTPQSLQEMNTIVNVPVGPLKPNVSKPIEEDPEIPMSNQTPLTLVKDPALTLHANEPLTLTPSSEPKGTLGKTYIPTPMVAPMKPMAGGRRVSIKNVTLMPKKVLKGLAGLFKRSRKSKRGCGCMTKRKHRH